MCNLETLFDFSPTNTDTLCFGFKVATASFSSLFESVCDQSTCESLTSSVVSFGTFPAKAINSGTTSIATRPVQYTCPDTTHCKYNYVCPKVDLCSCFTSLLLPLLPLLLVPALFPPAGPAPLPPPPPPPASVIPDVPLNDILGVIPNIILNDVTLASIFPPTAGNLPDPLPAPFPQRASCRVPVTP